MRQEKIYVEIFPYLDFLITASKFAILSSTSCCRLVLTLATPANISNTSQPYQHQPTLPTPANITNTSQPYQHQPTLTYFIHNINFDDFDLMEDLHDSNLEVLTGVWLRYSTHEPGQQHQLMKEWSATQNQSIVTVTGLCALVPDI